ELLLGHTVDTNAAELGRALAAAGVEIDRHITVADRADAIRSAVAESLARAGAVLTTGGLGPTRDDVTKTAVAELLGRALVLDDALLHGLEERFRTLGRWPMPEVNRSQAMIPEGATVLPNPRGTAPGLWMEDERGRLVVMLPGVPREMRGLLVEEVLPRLVARQQRAGGAPAVVLSRTVRTTGIPESALAGGASAWRNRARAACWGNGSPPSQAPRTCLSAEWSRTQTASRPTCSASRPRSSSGTGRCRKRPSG